MTESQNSHLGDYYLINSNHIYKSISPTPNENLLKKYNLEHVIESVSRTKPDGSKGVKLRKSYKNHINELPGKHQISPSKPIPPGLINSTMESGGGGGIEIELIDAGLLNKALKFDKTPMNGIPGFNSSDLAINDQQTLMRGDDDLNDDEFGKKVKKRKKNQNSNGATTSGGGGGDLKRQHI